MDLDESVIYKVFREDFNSFPIGYPIKRSGVELEILKCLFTTEEAIIAKNFKYSSPNFNDNHLAKVAFFILISCYFRSNLIEQSSSFAQPPKLVPLISA